PIFSDIVATGFHRLTLMNAGGFNFRVITEQRFGGVAVVPPINDPYAGNGLPLIMLTGINLAPTAPGAGAVAADTTATGGLGVVAQTPPPVAPYPAPARSIRWTVVSGDMIITANNPAVLPARATLRAGSRAGVFQVRAEDTVHPNRQVVGPVTIQGVSLTNINAVPSPVPAGLLSTNVSVTGVPADRRGPAGAGQPCLAPLLPGGSP